MIILFNLLIAIMSDTYERVRENEENTFLRTRADTICDMQKLSFRTINYQPWVHALLPDDTTSDVVVNRGWKGKLCEIKDLIKVMKSDFSRELASVASELREDFAASQMKKEKKE